MSRIGKLPIQLPSGTTVVVSDGNVHVKGPKGELARQVVAGVDVNVEAGQVKVLRQNEDRQTRSNHGLFRALLSNMVVGVSKGFERRLDIQGVGFKGEIKGKSLVLSLGFSHPIEFPFPPGVTLEVEKGTKILVKGSDKEVVGETSARLRKLRPPDSYKGKGVRYEGEKIRLKAGKTAKK